MEFPLSISQASAPHMDFPLSNLFHWMSNLGNRHLLHDLQIAEILEDVLKEMDCYFKNLGISDSIEILDIDIDHLVNVFKGVLKRVGGSRKFYDGWSKKIKDLNWKPIDELHSKFFYPDWSNEKVDSLTNYLVHVLDPIAEEMIKEIAQSVERPDETETKNEKEDLFERFINDFSTFEKMSFVNKKGETCYYLKVSSLFLLTLILVNEIAFYEDDSGNNDKELLERLDQVEAQLAESAKHKIQELFS